MQEKTLFKLAITTSLAGLFILIIITEKLDLAESNISSINRSLIDSKVKIKGVVSSKKDLPNIVILNITNNDDSIKVVAYKDSNGISIKKDDIIEVIGTVKEYKNDIEIDADLITK